MTPKEKALDLVDKLYQTTPNEAWFNPPLGSLSMEYGAWKQSKECALIAVDEILQAINVNTGNAAQGRLINELNKYWIKVKQEIEKT